MPIRDVPFVDFGRGLSEQRSTLLDVLGRVIDSGWLIHGAEHAAFESDLADYLGVGHVVGVGNGTDALELALRAARTDDRATVLSVANAGGYTTTAAQLVGLDVRHVDVLEATHLIDPEQVAAAVDDDVFAVVVTHLYGRAADVEGVRRALGGRDVTIIEDCAQSIGARRPEGMTGSLGDLATFSFYPTKNLGALGDGGAVATSDGRVAERLRRLRQYGWDSKYEAVIRGGRNSRLDEVQAAILRMRLPLVDEWNERRRAIIQRYAASAPPSVTVLPAEGADHVGHLAVVVTRDASALATHLAGHGVSTAVHYPIPDHRQPIHSGVSPALPVTERLIGQILTLPCYPEMTDEEIIHVSGALHAFRD